MSIPQICPCCSNHISEPHHPDCSFGTAEYACLGWPNYTIPSDALMTGTGIHIWDLANESVGQTLPLDRFLKEPARNDHSTAIRRLLEYLEEEPDENAKPDLDAITHLIRRAEELRKEAAGMYHVEARAKRIFAADILTQIVEELQASGE